MPMRQSVVEVGIVREAALGDCGDAGEIVQPGKAQCQPLVRGPLGHDRCV